MSLDIRPSSGALAEPPTNGPLGTCLDYSLTFFADLKSRSTHPVHARLQGSNGPLSTGDAAAKSFFSLVVSLLRVCVLCACEIA
jgi:hypothetical protein